MRKIRLKIIPGDGIGKEVVPAGLRVLEAAGRRFGIEFDWQHFDWSCETYHATGRMMPEDGIEQLRGFDAILLGAIGHPEVKPGILEKGILLKARFALDQYINLRPVKLYPGVETPLKDKGADDIDFVVFRENTEGLYVGMGGNFKKGTPDEIAVQEDVNTRKGVERVTKKGLVVAGKEYELDCIIYASGFEVGTDQTERNGFDVTGANQTIGDFKYVLILKRIKAPKTKVDIRDFSPPIPPSHRMMK